MSTLVVDGANYQLWSPPDEEEDFRPLVEEHVNEIFGNPSLTFNLRHTVKMLSGKGAIPDSFVLSLSPSPAFWVVENELAKHPVYEHIMSQLGKFMNAMRQREQRMEVADKLYAAIMSDPIAEATIKKVVNPRDLFKFVSDQVNDARFVVVIDAHSSELEDACEALPKKPEVITLKTYVRDPSNPSIHACVFDSLVRVRETPAPSRVRGVPTKAKSLQLEFWEGFADYVKKSSIPLRLRKPRPQHWFDVSIGSSKAHLALTANTQKNLLGCELYISKQKRIFDILSRNRSEIEKSVGEKLDWQQLPNAKASRIRLTSSADFADKAQWPSYFRWLAERIERFREAFQEPLKEAATSLK